MQSVRGLAVSRRRTSRFVHPVLGARRPAPHGHKSQESQLFKAIRPDSIRPREDPFEAFLEYLKRTRFLKWGLVGSRRHTITDRRETGGRLGWPASLGLHGRAGAVFQGGIGEVVPVLGKHQCTRPPFLRVHCPPPS